MSRKRVPRAVPPKKALIELGRVLGATVAWDGGKWTATFDHVESKYVNPGRPVVLRGSRRDLHNDLQGIVRFREAHDLPLPVPAYGNPKGD